MLRRTVVRHVLRACRSLDACKGVDMTVLVDMIPDALQAGRPASGAPASDSAEASHVGDIISTLRSRATLSEGARAGFDALRSQRAIDASFWSSLLFVLRGLSTCAAHAASSLTDDAAALASLQREADELRSRMRPTSAVQVVTPGVLAASPVHDTTSTGRKVLFLFDISREPESPTWTARALHVNLPLFKSASTSTASDMGRLGTCALFYGGAPPIHASIRNQSGLYILHRIPQLQSSVALDSDDAPVEVVNAGPHGLCFGADVADLNRALEAGEATPADLKVMLHSCDFTLKGDAEGALDAGELEDFKLLAGPGIADLILLNASADATWTAAIHAVDNSVPGGRRCVFPSLKCMREVEAALAAIPWPTAVPRT